MTDLPPKGTTQTDGEFILVQDGFQCLLGVKPVKPGASINFQNVGSYAPVFSNANPFDNQQSSTPDLTCTLCNDLTFYFGMTTGGGTPESYPYIIHVTESGQDGATFRMVDDKLRIVLSVTGSTSQASKILFTKESFTDAVEIKLTYNGQEETATIPENQADGVWTLTPTSVPATMTFKATNLNQVLLCNVFEVVGSEEGDLEVIPP